MDAPARARCTRSPPAWRLARRMPRLAAPGSLIWGMVADGYRPDRYDVVGALVCLVGVAIIMYAPRS